MMKLIEGLSSHKDSDSDLSKCPFCGSSSINRSSSLHCWEIQYECGCEVGGAIASEEYEVYLTEECKTEKK